MRQGRGTQARGRRFAAALALAAALIVAPAHAEAPRAHLQFALDLASQEPGGPTAMRLRAGFPDRNGKPPRLLRIVYDLPSGLVLDPTVVPACSATDDELKTVGRDACPADTRVGHGSLVAVTGFGPPFDPFPTEATIFQGQGQLIEVFTPPGSDRVVAIDHARIGPGPTLTLNPPDSPGGPPDGRTTPRSVDFLFPDRSTAGRPWLRTPPGCPDPRGWVSRATATYDGGETESATATTPCRTASGVVVPRPKRLHLSVLPRRVVAGRRVRFRVRVSGPPECVAAAVVSFHGRRWSAGRDGRRTVEARFVRTGRHYATVAARGCVSASATVRAVG